MISSYLAENEFDGEIPANVEVVLIFEVDDVQVTVPGTAPPPTFATVPHSAQFIFTSALDQISALMDEDLATHQEQAAQSVFTAALAHLDPDHVPPAELPPPSYEGSAHWLDDAVATQDPSTVSNPSWTKSRQGSQIFADDDPPQQAAPTPQQAAPAPTPPAASAAEPSPSTPLRPNQTTTYMQAWLTISTPAFAGLIGVELESAFQRVLPAVRAMAVFMDPSIPQDFVPYVPLMAVAMAYPNRFEQAHQVASEAHPPPQPIQPSQVAADMEALTARAKAKDAIDSIFSDLASPPPQQASVQHAAPARVRTPLPATVSPPPEANQATLVILPMDREVLAYLTQVLNGEPITLEQLSYQLMETFPHLVLSATGLIKEMCPIGNTFSECVAAYIEVYSNLPANGLETPYFFEEDEDEIEGDSGNEMPPEWGTDNGWPCVWIHDAQRPIELGETIIISDLDSVPHPGEGRY